MRVKNDALLWVLGGAMVFLMLVVYVPFLSKLFHFTFMHPRDLAVAFGAGLFSILWFEIAKIVFRMKKIEITKEKS
jgi:Ca2+-transporting ATPase